MTADQATGEKKERFAPKTAVTLNPPKDDPITVEELAKCDGEHEGYPTYVAIKGTVFDVSGNKAYGPGANYHVFTGKEPNKALGLSSLKKEDCVPEYDGLDETARKTLDDWYTFFSKRYNIVGKVVR